MPSVFIFGIALAYLVFLFLVASYGDRKAAIYGPGKAQPLIYALSLAVYCTSWTFFGSVGLASQTGPEFLAIYIGPILVFTLGNRLVRHIVRLAKAERITSIADFLASRYGKSISVAALATIIATIGIVPYIALQLKAIAGAVELMALTNFAPSTMLNSVAGDISLFIAVFLAIFAALFGTRHADATEHQEGMMLAISVESIVKLAVFLAVGAYVTFFMFGSPSGLVETIGAHAAVEQAIAYETPISRWIALTLMSSIAILALPRQFHVGVVECRNETDVKTAAWLFPLYLVLINLFVLPIAFAGKAVIGNVHNADLYILALPLARGQDALALAVFVGGLSAATAMVIVACVALSIMISNHIVMPVLIRRMETVSNGGMADRARLILLVRRLAIAAIMLCAFAYYRAARNEIPLASIGLLSFAAVAQFAPALFGGLLWRRANARGAILGMSAGFAVWVFVLLLPTLSSMSDANFATAPFTATFWRLATAFQFSGDSLTQGVFLSLLVNTALFIAGSLSRLPMPLERIQANVFVPQDVTPIPNLKRFKTQVTVDDMRDVVSKYLGPERAKRSFDLYELQEGRALKGTEAASPALVRYAEQLLASAVGSSSARLVLSLMFQKQDRSAREAYKLLDDATEALQQNRGLLQTALDQMEQGITVLDENFRLTCWNRQFRRLFDLPDHFGRVGISVGEVLHHLAEAGEIPSEIGTDAINRLMSFGKPWTINLEKSGRIVEIRTNPMPDGGIVATYTDITAAVEADLALKKANESLEQRVADRTSELTQVNEALAKAQNEAEEANIGKTRFLAASGHDILQPLNAARLYCASLIERQGDADQKELATYIDSSLDSVESILGAVLEISRLDTGALKPSVSRFAANDILRQVYTDFAPLAEKKGLRLTFVPTSIWLETDRNLFRRLVQNLVSNAIKYTRKGGVVFGFRRRGSSVELQVLDTGIGIAPDKLAAVFKEFTRLDEGMREADGHGLGLSIVERIARVLKIDLSISSEPGSGTQISVRLPEGSASDRPAREDIIVPIAGAPAANLGGTRIICIDNDRKVLDGMLLLLGGWGCQTVAAVGPEALGEDDLATPPDLILADYHLDEGNGIDAIIALRKRFGEPITAYLVTADRSAEVRDRAKKLGIAVINKPVKPAILRAAIGSVSRSPVAAE